MDPELDSLLGQTAYIIEKWLTEHREALDSYLAAEARSLDTTELIDVACRMELATARLNPRDTEIQQEIVKRLGRTCLFLTIMRDHGAAFDRELATSVVKEMLATAQIADEFVED